MALLSDKKTLEVQRLAGSNPILKISNICYENPF